MASEVSEQNRDRGTSTEKKLDDLYELIDGIEVCMMTTRRADGHLVTRPMQVQERTSGTDLWFVTDVETHKLDELLTDPHINLAFYHNRTREWVSVSGTAIVSRDERLIDALYRADWKTWFPEQDEQRDGSARDPRIALILVEAHSVTYFKSSKSRPAVLFEVAKARLTGEAPKLGEERRLGIREIEKAQRLEQEGRTP